MSVNKIEKQTKSGKVSTTKEVSQTKTTSSNTDKSQMEDILVNLKACCNLFINATVEASTPKVHSSFESALSDSLKMQNETYTTMSSKGWYQAKQVPPTKITQTRKKTMQQA